MKLIVGLGNPGRKYFETRHNVGFRAVKKIADQFKILNINKECEALAAKGKIKNNQVVLAQPLTFMNRSGRSVLKLIDKYNIDFKDIVVIYDDIDLPPGKIRIKETGGSGGHKGLKSIIDTLDTIEIKRVRIGVGRPIVNEVSDYVLEPFDSEQEPKIKKALKIIPEIVTEIFENGIEQTMNKFN